MLDELVFSNKMTWPMVPAAPEPMPAVTESSDVEQFASPRAIVVLVVVVLDATVVDVEVVLDGAAAGLLEHEASPRAQPPTNAIFPTSDHARCPVFISPRSAVATLQASSASEGQ